MRCTFQEYVAGRSLRKALVASDWEPPHAEVSEMVLCKAGHTPVSPPSTPSLSLSHDGLKECLREPSPEALSAGAVAEAALSLQIEDGSMAFRTRGKRLRKDSVTEQEQAVSGGMLTQLAHPSPIAKGKRSRRRNSGASKDFVVNLVDPVAVQQAVRVQAATFVSQPAQPSSSRHQSGHAPDLLSKPLNGQELDTSSHLCNQLVEVCNGQLVEYLDCSQSKHSDLSETPENNLSLSHSTDPQSLTPEDHDSASNKLMGQTFGALMSTIPSASIEFTPEEEIRIQGLSMWAKSWLKLRFPPFHQTFQVPSSVMEEVKADMESKPPPYVQLRRNEYLVKRPRKVRDEDGHQCLCKPAPLGPDGRPVGVSCGKDCLCALLFNSCSKQCACQTRGSHQAGSCSNRAFQHRASAKMKVVKTPECGWGVVLLEDKKAGDFIVEYVGEVIDDATCEQRLWDLKAAGETNFYLCEVSREYVIDASFKGNPSRFVNHSCNPNLELQKWHMDGEIRVGLFALRDIPRGTALAYDYQFIQFGEGRKCCCGAANCRGQLGARQNRVAAALASQGPGLALPSFPRRARTQPSKQPKAGGPDTAPASPGYSAPLAEQNRQSRKWHSYGNSEGGSGAHCSRQQQQQQQSGFSLGSALGKRRREESEVGESAVGRRVRVWWPLEQKYFQGAVEGYNEVTGHHLVRYDDGDEELLVLKKEQWQFEAKLLRPAGPIAARGEQPCGLRRDWSAYCGCSVRVWSSTMHRFRYGVLEEVPQWFRPRAQVRYEDGERLWIDMSQERWESLSAKRETFGVDCLALLTR